MQSKRNYSLNSMARGYSNYHGKKTGRKILIICTLILVILLCAAFLFLQNYMVYDSDGSVSMKSPFEETETVSPASSVPEEEITIEYIEPPTPPDPYDSLQSIHASQLADGELQLEPAEVLEKDGDALLITVKRLNGTLTYQSDLLSGTNVGMDEAPAKENLQTILNSGCYTIADISCFRDSSYVYVKDTAIDNAGTNVFWYDAEGMAWLDPSNPDVLSYTIALCQECLDMGFNEILLDYYSYPTTGRLDNISIPAETDRIAELSSFIDALRSALPENTVLSVKLNSGISEEYGLSADLLYTKFDRIYIAEGVDASYLLSSLPKNFNYEKRMVKFCIDPPQEGCYVKSAATK